MWFKINKLNYGKDDAEKCALIDGALLRDNAM